MTEREDFLNWFETSLQGAEFALHNGDASPRREMWSRNEPVSVTGDCPPNPQGATAQGQQELDELFSALGDSFADCESHDFELLTYDVVGDMAYTAALEHTTTSVDGKPRTYTLRATQVYRREDGDWKVIHRQGNTVQ